MGEYRVIDGCPARLTIAPYIAVLMADAKTVADSIYRGDDARAILNAHGKHSQYQLYHATAVERIAWGIDGQPDRPGESTHELLSDGRAYPHIPARERLAWWQQGFDVPTEDASRCIEVAHSHGWELFRPYDSGVEIHHLNFRSQPSPHSTRMRLRIIRLRATLPRR
jgi:hypothetical protein